MVLSAGTTGAVGIGSVSKPEEQLALQLKSAHIEFTREYRPWKARRYRFDFCIHPYEFANVTFILIEVQGGIWNKGAHSSGIGITRDCEKYCLAAIDGYLVMPVTPDQIKSGKALQWIEKAIGRG